MVGVAAVALVGLAAIIAANEKKRNNTVWLVFVHANYYDARIVQGFAEAMKKEWGIEVRHTHFEPTRKLDNQQDFIAWKKELGLQDYYVIFVAPNDYDLFNPNMYDAYMFPERKVGFLDETNAQDYYLVSHEILHMWIYAQGGKSPNQWSKKVHARTNKPIPDMVRVDVKLRMGKYVSDYGYTVVPKFSF